LAVKLIVGVNDLAATHPHFASEWHPTKNGQLTPQMVSKGSGKKVWWLGNLCHHEWESSINHRTSRGSGCHYCASKKVLLGFNDLATINPTVAAEWHPTKNGDLTPQQISTKSNKKIWWIGSSCGHEWDVAPSERVRGYGCPICTSKRVLKGYNDLMTTHPVLAAEWHPTKNGTLTPTEILTASNKKYWWLGIDCGHEWEASASNRTAKVATGCSICAGKVILAGFNDLASQNPRLAMQWHPIKNGEIRPDQIGVAVATMFWWLGDCGHVWKASPNSRSGRRKHHGCPFCSGRRVQRGFNDLSTTHPILSNEWHPTKNGDLSPDQINAGSHKKVWWLGICNHEWQTAIYSRAAGNGCNRCSNNVSKSEEIIKDCLLDLGLQVEGSNRTILGGGKEIDLWIPAKNFGIEFNGVYWHSEKYRSKDFHHDKRQAAQKAGIQLIQVWEDDWNQKPDLVKRVFAQKLGVAEKVSAKDTDVVTVSEQQAEEFLNANHLQGFASGSHHLGLVSKGDIETLRALVVLEEEPGNTLNIVRYATSANVVGGFTKLLSYATETFKPESVTAIADHCMFDDGLYENNGFIADKVLPPDYMYVVRNERKPRSEYPLERFRDDPKLLWEEGLTEMELADLNGLDRIWDAGKTSYKLLVTTKVEGKL
jgi:hypothetical protein